MSKRTDRRALASRILSFACGLAVASVVVVVAAVPALAQSDATHNMYRLYNPYSGEHLYTADKRERYGAISVGWLYEGVGWVAPDESDVPVYRLYNPYTGEHHYTTGREETDQLVQLGWVDEGVGWYSDEEGTPVYRQYNPYEPAFNHNYTTGTEERDQLVRLGWHDEGVGWYASDEAADVPTIRDFLKHAIEPIGSTLYVYGGGWNDADDAAGTDACRIGVSPRWAEFAAQQDSSYDYSNYLYWVHDGLDCSGFVGWVVYNTFEDTSQANDGYVMLADRMARTYADYGWGTYTPVGLSEDWRAGDIMSMDDHVWIALGTCADGSVLFVHASPPAVSLCGTRLPDGSRSQAVALADQYMSEHYSVWYEKYPSVARNASYLTTSSRMRWNRTTLADPEGLTQKSAEEVVAALFS